MTLPTYPATFPAPERSGISGQISVGLRRTSVPVALANQTKDYNAARVDMSYRFAMTVDQAIEWMGWVYNTIKWDWFLMDIVGPYEPRNIVSTHTVRVSGPLLYEKLGDNWCAIVAPLEVVQNDPDDPFVPAQDFDWIYAGSPGIPSDDWIIAGTPADPSLPVVISHLYWRY